MSRKSELAKVQRKEYYLKYPSFTIDHESCHGKSKQFMDAVMAAAAKVRFDTAILRLGPGDDEILRGIKKWGYEDAIRILSKSNPQELELINTSAVLGPSTVLYRMVDTMFPTILERYIPYSMAIAKPFGKDLRITFHELTAISTNSGHAFCSPIGHVIGSIDGVERMVVFTHHAISRLRSRLFPADEWKSFGACGDMYACLDGTCALEQITSADDSGGTLMALFVISAPGNFVNSRIPERVFGSVDRLQNDYYSLAGYIPIVRDGDLLVAKTLLLPGMRETPEHTIIRTMHSKDQGGAMKALHRTVFDHKTPIDYDLLRFFHESGAHQVVAKSKNRMNTCVIRVPEQASFLPLDSALDE